MLPTARKAGVTTPGDVCANSSTRRGATPVCRTASMFASWPSDRYARPQQASLSTSSSESPTSIGKTSKAGAVCSRAGCGLPRHKLLRAHVAFLSAGTPLVVRISSTKGAMTPCASVKSRSATESPAMLPSAHTACSRTSPFGEPNNRMKAGSAPTSTTALVCGAEPEAMLVSTHKISNWSSNEPVSEASCTKRGTTPRSMTSWIGGWSSLETNFRNACVATNCFSDTCDMSIRCSASYCSFDGACGS
mmetsp:Transcript_99774/g.281696  ORF Transcript_99774/g.281696 Transcript_99774/m.281696 type:complete len:248 (-) Transcript_99774:695-1438(-)